MRGHTTPSMRRPYIYPHRSTRMLPLVRRRFAGAVLAAAAMTVAVWYWLDWLLLAHNTVAVALADLAGVRSVQVVDTFAFGRTIPAVVTYAVTTSSWIPYVAALAAAAVLALLALYAPLSRGIVAFMLTAIAASAAAHYAGASTLARADTFPIVWTQSELLVWLVLPSMTGLLFVTSQPSWLRGLCWMAGLEAFAVLWSAARLVVLLGVAQALGPVLLPPLWFVWGLLADVVYVTTFFSIAVHVNLRLTPEHRAAWAS